MNPLRSLLALLVGLGLFRLVATVLEITLVGAVADGPVTNEAEYFAVRNQPGMLAAAIAYNSVAAFLAGYVTAKIASTQELMHTGVAAAVQTVALIWDFAAGPYASLTPVWTRVALVLFTGPAMMAGPRFALVQPTSTCRRTLRHLRRGRLSPA